jgi:hypothetical protein
MSSHHKLTESEDYVYACWFYVCSNIALLLAGCGLESAGRQRFILQTADGVFRRALGVLFQAWP